MRTVRRGAGLLTVLAWAFAASIHAAETSPVDGNEKPSMMQEASERIAAWLSLSAKIRQRVDMFGQQLVGSGLYLQQRSPRGLLLRLELRLDVGGRLSSLEQVCDGRFLWIRRELAGGETLGRVDLDQIRTAIGPSSPQAWTDASTNWLALGGLPRLMSNLTENFACGAPQPNRIGSTPVWMVEGRWKRERLASLLPSQKDRISAEAPVDTRQLPPHLPDCVFVALRKDDLFPVRIDFRRSEGDSRGSDAGSAGESQSMMVLEFLDILAPARLDDAQFRYQPGKQEVVDHTEPYLQTLKAAW